MNASFYRFRVVSSSLLVAALAGWLAQRGGSPESDEAPPRALDRAFLAGSGSARVAGVAGPDAASPLAAQATAAAGQVHGRGAQRAEENAALRQSLAEGKAAPLPAALQVADLPLGNSLGSGKER